MMTRGEPGSLASPFAGHLAICDDFGCRRPALAAIALGPSLRGGRDAFRDIDSDQAATHPDIYFRDLPPDLVTLRTTPATGSVPKCVEPGA